MPSVVVMPTERPIPLKMWAIIRVVVVLPLEPVTATIGMREGLGYGKNDVAVVLNVTGDHLGLKGIDSLEQLAAVSRSWSRPSRRRDGPC